MEKKTIWIILSIILACGVVAGAVFFFLHFSKNDNQKVEPITPQTITLDASIDSLTLNNIATKLGYNLDNITFVCSDNAVEIDFSNNIIVVNGYGDFVVKIKNKILTQTLATLNIKNYPTSTDFAFTYDSLSLYTNKTPTSNLVEIVDSVTAQIYDLKFFEFTYDKNIITLSGNTIIANAVGTTTLVATMNNASASLTINIYEWNYANAIAFENDEITADLKDGDFEINAQVSRINQSELVDSVTYSIISGNNVIELENNLIKPKQVGKAVVRTSVLSSESETIFADLTINIVDESEPQESEPEILEVSAFYQFNNNEIELLGETERDVTYYTIYNAKGDANALNKALEDGKPYYLELKTNLPCNIEIANNNIINQNNFIFTALKSGTQNITITTIDSKITKYIAIEVKDIAIQNIKFNLDSNITLYLDGDNTLDCTPTYAPIYASEMPELIIEINDNNAGASQNPNLIVSNNLITGLHETTLAVSVSINVVGHSAYSKTLTILVLEKRVNISLTNYFRTLTFTSETGVLQSINAIEPDNYYFVLISDSDPDSSVTSINLYLYNEVDESWANSNSALKIELTGITACFMIKQINTLSEKYQTKLKVEIVKNAIKFYEIFNLAIK